MTSRRHPYFRSRRRVEIEREKFTAAYNALCSDKGIESMDFASAHGVVLNIFELFCCVKWHGGSEKISNDRLWHRIAYELCRSSKRSRSATAAVKECYAKYLAPLENDLGALELKPFLRPKRAHDICIHTDCSFSADPSMDCRGQGPKLRQRVQQPKSPRLKRFKGQTSFDLLTTIPLKSEKSFLRCIAPSRLIPESPVISSTGSGLKDAVRWLEEFAKAPLEEDSDPLRFRYSSQLLRLRKRLYWNSKKQSKSIIRKQSGEASESGTRESEDDSDEDKPNIMMEGPQYQAEITPMLSNCDIEADDSKWDGHVIHTLAPEK